MVKDYFVCAAVQNGEMTKFWCSSTSWVFSQLPAVVAGAQDVERIRSINNLFTGEFESILFPGSGEPQVINAELGIVLQPKPITELDRLSFMVHQLEQSCFVSPRGKMKYVPSGKVVPNEAFRGLSLEEASDLNNWQFLTPPKDPEVRGVIERGEQTYNDACFDKVSSAFPKNSWSVQGDVTGTLVTLKSHLWPGFYAFHRAQTDIVGMIYVGDGVRNSNLAFMV